MDHGPSRCEVFLAILAYLPVLFLIPLAMPKAHRFLKFHARQGLYFFSVSLVAFIVLIGLAYFVLQVWKAPFVVQNVVAVLVGLAFIFYVAALVYMVVNVLRRKMTMLPILGDFAGEG